MAKKSKTKKAAKPVKAKPAKKPVAKPVKKAKQPAAKKPAAKHVAKKALPAKPAGPSVAAEHKRRAIAALQWVHGTTAALLAEWPAELLTAQPTGKDNHALWTMGHLSTFYAWATAMLSGKATEVPAAVAAACSYKTTPVSDASVYDAALIRSTFDATFAGLIAAAEALSDAEVTAPPAVDSYGVADDRLDALHRAAWHEGWHQGQLSALRRALGLKGIM